MPLAKAQRGDAGAFADGLFDLLGGADTDEAAAASLNLARILLLVANSHMNNEFTKT